VLACDLASSQPAAGVSIILALKGANNEKALYIFPSLSGLFATKKNEEKSGQMQIPTSCCDHHPMPAGFLQKGGVMLL